MTQVVEIVKDAMRHLRILAVGETPSAEDVAEGIRSLNLRMRALEADDGVAMGWQDVSNPGETLPIRVEDERAVGYLLALEMRPKFGVQLDPDVLAAAESGLAGLRARTLTTDAARIEYDLPGCGPCQDFYG